VIVHLSVVRLLPGMLLFLFLDQIWMIFLVCYLNHCLVYYDQLLHLKRSSFCFRFDFLFYCYMWKVIQMLFASECQNRSAVIKGRVYASLFWSKIFWVLLIDPLLENCWYIYLESIDITVCDLSPFCLSLFWDYCYSDCIDLWCLIILKVGFLSYCQRSNFIV
jgi:hypothetical protein